MKNKLMASFIENVCNSNGTSIYSRIEFLGGNAFRADTQDGLHILKVAEGKVFDETHGSQPEQWVITENWKTILREFLCTLQESFGFEEVIFDMRDLMVRAVVKKVFTAEELLTLHERLAICEAKTGFTISLLCLQDFLPKKSFKVVSSREDYSIQYKTVRSSDSDGKNLFDLSGSISATYSIEALPASLRSDFAAESDYFLGISDRGADILTRSK